MSGMILIFAVAMSMVISYAEKKMAANDEPASEPVTEEK
jgi:hypothetical protein